MYETLRLVVFRCAALVGAAASAVLLGGSGCGYDACSSSPILPILGMTGFSVLLFLSLLRRWQRLTRILSCSAGITGIALLAAQVALNSQVCMLCAASDVAGVIVAVAGVAAPAVGSARHPIRWCWLVVLLFTLVVSWRGWSGSRIPTEVSRHWSPGLVTIVEVTDFECPHCRRLHPKLQELVQRNSERVRLVRYVMPLPYHPNSHAAARAFHCAEEQDKGAIMACRLFRLANLGEADYAKLAQELGLNAGPFDACFSRCEGIQDEEFRWVKESGARGLPAIWIEDQLLSGRTALDRLEITLDRAIRKLEASAKNERSPSNVKGLSPATKSSTRLNRTRSPESRLVEAGDTGAEGEAH